MFSSAITCVSSTSWASSKCLRKLREQLVRDFHRSAVHPHRVVEDEPVGVVEQRAGPVGGQRQQPGMKHGSRPLAAAGSQSTAGGQHGSATSI